MVERVLAFDESVEGFEGVFDVQSGELKLGLLDGIFALIDLVHDEV